MGLTRRRFIHRAGAAGVAAAARWLSPPPSASAADDPVAYSFVVMGCNRINGGDIRPDNPSTANLPQITRSFAEIARLEPAPSLLFFTGDLVFGLDHDVLVLERQLRAWIELYRASPVGRMSGIRLVDSRLKWLAHARLDFRVRSPRLRLQLAHPEYASPTAFGRRLAAGPFSSL